MVGLGRRGTRAKRRRASTSQVPVRVLLGAPHKMLRQALSAVLGSHPQLRIVGEVATGKDALLWALEVRPDITLLDERLSPIANLHAATLIWKEAPELRVVTLTDGEPSDRNAPAFAGEVAARVSKRLDTQALIDVLLRVADGEVPGDVPAAPPTRTVRRGGSILRHGLKASEQQLLELLADGSDNRALAEQLGCTEKTVRNRLSELYTKLHLHNRTQAALFAVRSGLGDPTEGGDA